MIAFDTDILTDLLLGKEQVVALVAAIPIVEQALPIIVAEEILRGRLDLVRRAEAGKGKMSVETAYHFLRQTLIDLRLINILPYTAEAEARFSDWKQQKLKVKTHDLRIAAIAVAHHAVLVSRNRRDFEKIPGLAVEFWA
jgi:tRNA(fMet)-specific endonuclease VapC